uniref:Uncharacterized protein n=1 Tax=Anopheles darlingi TaxID=43151 RepID=A0A2M4D4R5_ANODA
MPSVASGGLFFVVSVTISFSLLLSLVRCVAILGRIGLILDSSITVLLIPLLPLPPAGTLLSSTSLEIVAE